MQMGPGNAPRRADRTNDVPGGNPIAGLHINSAHVGVERLKSQTVLDKHGIAVEEVVAGFDDDAVSRCFDRRSQRRYRYHREACAAGR